MDDRDGGRGQEISVNALRGGGGSRSDLRGALRGLPPGKHSGYFVYELRVTPSPAPQPRRTRGQRAASLTDRAGTGQYVKQLYAQQRAVWSDAGRESAVAVTRLQVPFEVELFEGDGALRGTDAAQGPARAAEPLSAEMGKLVAARVSREADARKRLLSVDAEDVAASAEMLKRPDSDVIKLLPVNKYPQELLGMHGAAAYYDFARQSQHYRTGREMSLRDGKFACNYGFFLDLGDLSPARVADLTETPPTWADATVKRRWSDFWGASEHLPQDLVASLGKSERRGGPPGVQAQARHAYLFRSIDDVIHTDILVGFCVLRICDDGSAVMAYRILKEFERPRRQWTTAW
jgi:hypothetical protein